MTRNLSEQRNFYDRVLEFALVEEKAQAVLVQLGESLLTFRQAPDNWNGVYHLAFDILPNQFFKAKAGVEEQVPLVTDASGDSRIYKATR